MKKPTPWSAVLLAPFVVAESSAEVDYATEVQPILAEHCFHCHGPDEETQEAGLRLDVREAAIIKGEEHAIAIVPGDPDASELMKRITSHDPELIMPPKEAAPVDAADIETLRQWISEGAPYAEHWSFVPPEKAETSGSGNPIDELVKRRIAKEGYELSDYAEPSILSRRRQPSHEPSSCRPWQQAGQCLSLTLALFEQVASRAVPIPDPCLI